MHRTYSCVCVCARARARFSNNCNFSITFGITCHVLRLLFLLLSDEFVNGDSTVVEENIWFGGGGVQLWYVIAQRVQAFESH